MTDLEMTRLCAEAMGLKIDDDMDYIAWGTPNKYDPLHDDAQAMALVKNFRLDIYGVDSEVYGVQFMHGPNKQTNNQDLNRAIVECVAKMQKAK